jgi:hypothetical protein
VYVSRGFFLAECLANGPAQLLDEWRDLFPLSLGILFRNGGLLVQVVLFFMLHVLPYAIGLIGEITPLVPLRRASDLLVGVSAYKLIRRRASGLGVVRRLSRGDLRRKEVGSRVGVVDRGIVGWKVGKGVGCVVRERVSVLGQRVVDAEGSVLHLLRERVCRVLGAAVCRTLAGTRLGLHLVVCTAETSRCWSRVDAAWLPFEMAGAGR